MKGLEVLRVIRLALASVLVLVLAPAVYAAERSPGTCLTLEGVRIAPWTDAFDPACGPDCSGDEADEDDQCGAEECPLIEGAATAPRLPAPTGPRCLEAGATCGSGQGNIPLRFLFAGGAAVTPLVTAEPRRGSGTLPGAGPPEQAFHPYEIFPTSESPPPRA